MMKLIVIISTIGRRPSIAAPVAMPTKPFSAIGVSTTRMGPNSFKRPAVILYEPSKLPISSPIKKTFSSRVSSSRSVSFNTCRNVSSAITLSLSHRCIIGRVDEVKEALHGRVRTLLGELYSRRKLLLCLFLDICQGGVIQQTSVQQVPGKHRYR